MICLSKAPHNHLETWAPALQKSKSNAFRHSKTCCAVLVLAAVPGATLAASSHSCGEGLEVVGAQALLTSAVHGGRSCCMFPTAAFVWGLTGAAVPLQRPRSAAPSLHSEHSLCVDWHNGSSSSSSSLCGALPGPFITQKVGQAEAELPASGKSYPEKDIQR